MEARFPDGRIVPFDLNKANSIGRGATADVFFSIVGDKRYAAKIYKVEHTFDEEKISRMTKIGDPSSNSSFTFAWPGALIADSLKIVGYLMPIFEKSDYYPLNYYFDSTLFSKLNNLSILSLSNRLDIAASLSSAIAALHDRSIYFIDLKPQNILVNWRRNSVAILDCDGFCVRLTDGTLFPAGHISTDYIAPEVTLQNLRPAALSAPQDTYALAVILFQLFNYAQHPFQGVPAEESSRPFTNDELSAAGLYPCAINPNPKIKVRAGSTHICMPTDLRLLFDRSFIGQPGSRVSAREWYSYFSEVISEKKLQRCDNFPTDVNHIHFKDGTCSECNRTAFKASHSKPSQIVSNQRTPANRIEAAGGTQPAVSNPKASGSSAKWVWGTVIIVAFLYFIGFFNTNKTSTPVDSKQVTAVTEKTSVPTETIEKTSAPTKTTEKTSVPTNILDVFESNPGSVLSTEDTERLNFKTDSSGLKGDLEVFLSKNFDVASLSNPGIYIADNYCAPSKFEVEMIQDKLNALGYKAGSVDGIVGSGTRKALRKFQEVYGIPVSGELDRPTADALGVYVLAHDLTRYTFFGRGIFRNSENGPVILFSGVRNSPFCVYVTAK
jgi:serine/threonine protein kinase